jgi:Domain of unknown function (DUF4835)
MLRPLLLLCLALAARICVGQEFNCQVSVIAPQVANSDPRIFKGLENAIREFVSGRRWTNYNYEQQERLDLSLLLTISEQQGLDRFRGTLQVIYSRPVFNSDYMSPVFDLIDENVEFNFLENTQLDFTEDRFTNNLTSILAFYAFYTLAVDADTFRPLGGTDLYNQAQQVVNQAQNSSDAGWKAFEGQTNRFWLIDNAQQATFRPLRECLYSYHREGFDNLTADAEAARKSISSGIERLRTVHQAKPVSYNLQVFFNAKHKELVELFKPTEPAEKSKLLTTLQIIDPGHISSYQGMMRGN